ncbi:MAG: hypothetical protein HQK96_14140 [Nitrospirae bacterium]|nr:hypothetical protein [Nitrospirota bacterium]
MKTICHIDREEDPLNVLPNVIAGSYYSVEKMITVHDVDILVPLDTLPSEVDEWGFRGEVIHRFIEDRGALPIEELQEFIETLLMHINDNKKIGIFCIGGHGRTGYVLSCLIARMGHTDSVIDHVRKIYCHKAVESQEQEDSIAEYISLLRGRT